MKHAGFLAAAVILSSSSALALGQGEAPTPFGLRFGMPRAEIEKLAGYKAPTSGQTVAIVDPPQPHPDFVAYGVLASPTHGLCKVVAVGKTLQLNSFGDQIKAAFEETAKSLEGRYGKFKRADFLKTGSIWNEPDDWSMALAKEERSLAAMWEKPTPAFKACSSKRWPIAARLDSCVSATKAKILTPAEMNSSKRKAKSFKARRTDQA